VDWREIRQGLAALLEAESLIRGYQDVVLYHRENGEGRAQYLQAIRQADAHDLGPLQALISAQLRPLDE
jgi:hypothetical protein